MNASQKSQVPDDDSNDSHASVHHKASAKAEVNQDISMDSNGTVEALEEQVAELQEQLAKLTELAARAQADLQNAKMRMERDSDDIRKYAAEMVLRRLLPTVDNFQRAFTHLPKDLEQNDWVKGVAAIEQSFMKEVRDMGLQKLDALGENVDPSRHEVLMEGPGEKGKVIEIFEEGYELHGKILRPAKVKVGNGE